jgi:ribosomal-protein-alanine N-acetyltransferase
MTLGDSFSGALRTFAYFMASGTQNTLEGIDYLSLYGEEPSAIEQVFAIYANVIELDENGLVLNAKYAEKRATDYLRAYCDPAYTVEPPYEDWEVMLHNPPGLNDRKTGKHTREINFETIETERLVLRKLTPSTYRQMFETLSEAEIMNLLDLVDEEALHKEKQKYENGLSTYNRSFVNFQIIDKASGEILGACGFHTWYTEHARAEIGYALTNENTKAKGMMSEAMKAVLHYGFEHMRLNRVEALIGPNNTPSLKLAAKFGFTQEGRLRSHYFKNGIMEDSMVFGLLREEYEVS